MKNPIQEEPALPDLWALWRHPWSIVLCVAAFLGGAIYYVKHAGITYQSTAQILVMQREPNPPADQSTSVTGAVDEHVAKDLLGTHMQIIRSRKILDRAIEEKGLDKLPSLLAALEEDQTPAAYILENLVVTCGGEGQAQTAQTLTVTFKHGSPEDAALVLQAIIDVYQSFVREKFQDAGQQAAALIEKARDELGAELAQKDAAYVEFRQSTPLIWGGDESFGLREARLRELETALSEHKVRYAQLKARADIVSALMDHPEAGSVTDLDKMASIGETDVNRLSFLVGIERGDPVSEASRDQDVARYDQILALRLETAKQLLGLRLEARKLEAQFGGDNPGLLATREAIHELEKFEAETPNIVPGSSAGEVRPAELMKAYRGLLQHDLEEMDRRYEELEAQTATERATLDQQVAAGLKNDALRRDLDRTRSAYDTVVQRLQSLNLVKDYNALITEVITPVLPGIQVWPKALLVYALGIFVGGLFGCGAALLLDLRDRRFRGQEDIEQSLRLNVLTHIPDLKKSRNGARGADRFLLAQERPQSRAAEAFRDLRTTLCFGRGASQNNVIQVTSPSHGDGTTTVVTNLAISLAQTGKRVLILDANLRNPRVDQVFGVESSVGLSNYLTGEMELEAIVRPTRIENVSIIPGGPAPAAPSELLTSPRLDELIRSVREVFDFVLVDSPPLLGSSDALVLAARADGVLMQVRTTRSGRITALKARSRLEESRAVVMGVAVRDIGSNGTV